MTKYKDPLTQVSHEVWAELRSHRDRLDKLEAKEEANDFTAWSPSSLMASHARATDPTWRDKLYNEIIRRMEK